LIHRDTQIRSIIFALLLGAALPAGAQTTASTVSFSCAFANSPTDCGFFEQSYALPRATIVNTVARDGGTSLRLHTEPGDANVAGSGTSERDDLSLGQIYGEGMEQWWAHSVLLPDDYDVPVRPTDADWNWTVLFDFHHTGSTGQANFMVVVENDLPGSAALLRLRGFGGATVNDGAYGNDTGKYGAVIGPVVKNVWYDFVYHVRWSSNGDGFMQAWMNGVKKLDFVGATLYAGQGCYLKLANYHTATGKASSVVHDRVIRGTAQTDVSLTPLQGVSRTGNR